MAVTVLIRTRSGEVLKISLKGQPFDDRDTTYFSIQTDPPRPDGDEVRDLSGDDPGPLRVLGFAKIWDGTDVRNATQIEIDTFVSDEAEDEKDQDAAQAELLIDTHPVFGKVLAALLASAEEAQPPGMRRTKAVLKANAKSHVSRDD